jgi:hypothetical protein
VLYLACFVLSCMLFYTQYIWTCAAQKYYNSQCYETILNDRIMYICSSSYIVLKFLELFFFSLLNLGILLFLVTLERYKVPWGKYTKENITPCKMWIPVWPLRCRKYIYYELLFPQGEGMDYENRRGELEVVGNNNWWLFNCLMVVLNGGCLLLL